MADESPGMVKTLSSHQDDLMETEDAAGKNCLSSYTDGWRWHNTDQNGL